jgi:uncharacterized protein Smg (DUF494 family)
MRSFLGEDVVNEQMINLFSIIADQVREKQDLFDKEGKIMQELLNNGYPFYEADAALMLMQTFVQRRPDCFFTTQPAASSIFFRVMNREERERITNEAFIFLSKLTHLGIITADQREEVLEKALAVCPDRIELEHMKSLVAVILFALPQDQDGLDLLDYQSIKRTSWH